MTDIEKLAANIESLKYTVRLLTATNQLQEPLWGTAELKAFLNVQKITPEIIKEFGGFKLNHNSNEWRFRPLIVRSVIEKKSRKLTISDLKKK